MVELPHLGAILAAVALASGLVALGCGWPGRGRLASLAAAGGVLGVAAGVYLGMWLLGAWPNWPPREDQDRLLFLVFPAVVVVELVAAFFPAHPRLAWLLRFLVAAGVARVLLHGTTYLADLAGPGSREWSPFATSIILFSLCTALATTWAALAALASRRPGPLLGMALALTCAAAGVVVMLSGYASGGQIGLALAAGLAGAAGASLATRSDGRGLLGVGVVGLFSVLLIGRFFAELRPLDAAGLFFAPLVCWISELPLAWVRRASRVPDHYWLCLPPLVLCACDVSLTLLGQPADYWLGDRGAVCEANPLGRALLEIDPWLFLAGTIAWAAGFSTVLLLWRHRLAIGLAFLVTLGHAIGAACWLALTGYAGWVAALALLVATERLWSLAVPAGLLWPGRSSLR